MQRTTQQFWQSAGRAPSWLVIPWHLPYNRGRSTEKPKEKARKKESPFLPQLPALITYAIMMQFEDTLPVTTRYKKYLRVTFTHNSFSQRIILMRIIYFEVERCAGNTSVKSHLHALDIRRQNMK
jgi:hypothetical protein